MVIILRNMRPGLQMALANKHFVKLGYTSHSKYACLETTWTRHGYQAEFLILSIRYVNEIYTMASCVILW